MKKYILNPRGLLTIICLLAVTLLFWKSGSRDLMEWDEARNGVNAWYMFHNHDFVNYYYGNELDTWNAKPPLLIWLITLSYHLFGFNEFALRLPAIISTILFFIVFFKLINLFEGAITAFLTCIILLSCQAIVGPHVGISGDFDALLILFLTCSVYFFVLYLYKLRPSGLYWAALFLGLAFYAKGPSSLLYIPGMILFLLLTKQFLPILKNYRLYLSMLLFLTIASSWVVLVYLYGKSGSDSAYGADNSIEVMLIHDTFRRIASSEFSTNITKDYFFFFHSLESKMYIWNILFYPAVLTGLYFIYKNRNRFLSYAGKEENRFTLLSICLSLPVILTVNFAQNVQNWYFAPAWYFVAFLIARWMLYVAQKRRPVVYVWVLLGAFCLIRHFIFLNSQSTSLHTMFSKNNAVFTDAEYVVVVDNPTQDLALYLHWLEVGFYKAQNVEELNNQKGKVAIISNSEYNATQYELIECTDNYCLTRIK